MLSSVSRSATITLVGKSSSFLGTSRSATLCAVPGGMEKEVAPSTVVRILLGKRHCAAVPPALLSTSAARAAVPGLTGPKSGVDTMNSSGGMGGAWKSSATVWVVLSKRTLKDATFVFCAGVMRKITSVVSPGTRSRGGTGSTGISGGKTTEICSGLCDWFLTVARAVRDPSCCSSSTEPAASTVKGCLASPFSVSTAGSPGTGWTGNT